MYIFTIAFPEILQNMSMSDMHGFSQQDIWVSFWTPKPLKSTSQDTQNLLLGTSKNVNLKYIIDFCHLHLIPMTLYNNIMPYFDIFIHFYGWNLEYIVASLKIWTPEISTIIKFGHSVSKTWLRPCQYVYTFNGFPKQLLEEQKGFSNVRDSTSSSSSK